MDEEIKNIGGGYCEWRGQQCLPHWPKRVQDAQENKTYIIKEGLEYKEFERIPYGQEANDWGADQGVCHDCIVKKGELHVPGCDVERCPLCGYQCISCGCRHENDPDEEEE